MHLSAAIENHRVQLTRIVATLLAMIGFDDDATVERLASPLYRAVLRVLRPAESAVRRLIVVAAHGLTLEPPRAKPTNSTSRRAARKHSPRITFKLFDPRPRFASAFPHARRRLHINLVAQPAPRLRVIDTSFDPRVPLFRQSSPAPQQQPQAPAPEATVSASRLCRRLAAIKSALDNLPRQARRYARWQSKPLDERRPRLSSALRPGNPPGHRKNPLHAVEEILAESHWLARRAVSPNSS